MTAEPVAPPADDLDSALANARVLLARHFGFTDFRAPQIRVLESVLRRRDTLAVLPTGAGKSICFQIPALLTDGLTVVISPLVALMGDQVEAARARGIAARCLNSLQPKAVQDGIRGELGRGGVKLLYVAPERGATLVRELVASRVSVALLAVDEAHCVVEWGADFRPAYLGLGRLRRALGNPPTLALTGSATPSVRPRIASSLGLGRSGGFDLHLGSFDRRNLWFGVRVVRSEQARLSRLLEVLRTDDRVALVYAPTRNLTEALARVVREHGMRAAAYHAGLTRERRAEVLHGFLDDQVDVVTATCAFGLGIDKPNVRLVVHWTMPPTPEAYYQEAGRAGRDGHPSRCVLLYRRGDARRARRQLEVTFPPRRLVERVQAGRRSSADLPKNVRIAVERLATELHGGGSWTQILRRRREAEGRVDAMERFARSRTCRRAVLLGYFGESVPRCAGCDQCSAPSLGGQDATIQRRVRRLVAMSRGRTMLWPGALLDARAVARLAAEPPASVDALASVEGVGPTIAARFGTAILRAIDASGPAVEQEMAGSSVLEALLAWRARRARELVVSPPEVVPIATLRAIAAAGPRTRDELRAIQGVGPRFVLLETKSVLELLAAHRRVGRGATPVT